jgi:hypothetical protein
MIEINEDIKDGRTYSLVEPIPITKVINQPSHGPNTPYKQLDSANAFFTYHKDGTYEAYIEHSPMHNMTPEMLIWFFKHLDCYTRYNPCTKSFDGPEIPVYRLWHCRDHIAISPEKPGTDPIDKDCAISLGSTFTIEEILIQKHPVKASSIVYDLYYDYPDGTRIGGGSAPNGTNAHTSNIGNFGFWLLGPLGVQGGYINHYFQVIDPEKKTMAFQTRFVLGSKKFGPLNKLIKYLAPGRVAPDRLLKDWILHNIEESGETENIVPVLYANQDKVLRKSEITTRMVI